ncbi:hypothetical protein EMIT053CA3_100122 [Pseudomonas donghuensis]
MNSANGFLNLSSFLQVFVAKGFACDFLDRTFNFFNPAFYLILVHGALQCRLAIQRACCHAFIATTYKRFCAKEF